MLLETIFQGSLAILYIMPAEALSLFQTIITRIFLQQIDLQDRDSNSLQSKEQPYLQSKRFGHPKFWVLLP